MKKITLLNEIVNIIIIIIIIFYFIIYDLLYFQDLSFLGGGGRGHFCPYWIEDREMADRELQQRSLAGIELQ